MNGGFKIGDCDSKDAQSWIDSEYIFEIFLMLCKIDGFNLSFRWGTLFSSHMATGMMSSISM